MAKAEKPDSHDFTGEHKMVSLEFTELDRIRMKVLST